MDAPLSRGIAHYEHEGLPWIQNARLLLFRPSSFLCGALLPLLHVAHSSCSTSYRPGGLATRTMSCAWAYMQELVE